MYDENIITQIINSVDLVEYAEQYLDLVYKNGEYVSLCPFHKEDTPSFTISPKKKLYYCFGCGESGNVINFCSKIKHISFPSALKHLANEYNIQEDTSVKRSPIVKTLKELNGLKKPLEPVCHTILDKSELDKYEKADITEWIAEGIPQKIMDKYGVRYDNKSNRIVYPVYDTDGNLINIKGRTRMENWKALGLRKYSNYYPVGAVDYLQGLHLKKHLISQANEVIVFESIKSCMKADSWGYYNSVASETSHLNDYQTRLLLSLKCDIVLAFDNDVGFEKLLKNVSILRKFTNIYIIKDENGLLGDPSEKNSPVDKGREVWETLYASRKRI